MTQELPWDEGIVVMTYSKLITARRAPRGLPAALLDRTNTQRAHLFFVFPLPPNTCLPALA